MGPIQPGSLLTAAAATSAPETQQATALETPPQNPAVTSVPHTAPTPGIKSPFVVTFARSPANTRLLAEMMTSIGSSLGLQGLPEKEKKLLLSLLNQINSIINSVQMQEIPERSITDTFMRKVVKKILNNSSIPEHIRIASRTMIQGFYNCLHFDYFMFAAIDKPFCQSLAAFLSTLPEEKPLEVMAGAGWLQKGLAENGVKIQSTDSYRISASTRYQEEGQASSSFFETRMSEHSQDFKPISEAVVEKQDALEALEASSSKVVIMAWPDCRPDDLVFKILYHCYRHQKMVIHIAMTDESIHNMMINSGHFFQRNLFKPIEGAPAYHPYLEELSIGFWKEIPEWYKTMQEELKFKARHDFRIRHFHP